MPRRRYASLFTGAETAPSLHSSLTSRLRMRRRVFVAESALLKRSIGVIFVAALTNRLLDEGLRSLVGDAGADFETRCRSNSEIGVGKSSETVLFGQRENLGIGNELGGGEFE